MVLLIRVKKNLSMFSVTIQLEFLPRTEILSVVFSMVLYPAQAAKLTQLKTH